MSFSICLWYLVSLGCDITLCLLAGVLKYFNFSLRVLLVLKFASNWNSCSTFFGRMRGWNSWFLFWNWSGEIHYSTTGKVQRAHRHFARHPPNRTNFFSFSAVGSHSTSYSPLEVASSKKKRQVQTAVLGIGNVVVLFCYIPAQKSADVLWTGLILNSHFIISTRDSGAARSKSLSRSFKKTH